MKKLLAPVALLLILILTFGFFSCKKSKTEKTFLTSSAAARPLTYALEVSLGGNNFVTFLNRGMIKVSVTDDLGEHYGALDKDGNTLIEPTCSDLTMYGDFFLAKGSLATEAYTVYNKKGERLFGSEYPLKITDVGAGCVAVTVDEKRTCVFDDKGEDLLAGTSLDSTYEYTATEQYVTARSNAKKSLFIFRRSTGDTLLSLFGTESVSYDGFYLGGKDFLVLKEESVSGSGVYTYAVKKSSGTEYYRQTLLLYTMGNSTPRVVTSDRAVYSLTDRNARGYSQQDRESFPLKSGYFALRYYVTEKKVTDGTLAYELVDASLQRVAALPEGINPILRPVDGLAAALGDSGKIYLVNESLQVVLTKDDAPYQSLSFSGSTITASNLSAGAKRGVMDKSGKTVIPFEYSYISDFFGTKALAVKEGRAYLVDESGHAEYITDALFPYAWQGYYESKSGDKVGLTSFEGKSLVSPRFDYLIGSARFGQEVFVAMQAGTAQTVYRLF